MRYFPVFLDLTDARTVLVYGGGEEALRKCRLLLKTPCRISLIAATIEDELRNHVQSGRVSWHDGHYDVSQLDRAVSAVFIAPDVPEAAEIASAARARNIPVNVIDRPGLSTFIVPAMVDRDPLVIAIGTEGAGPVFAQRLRSTLDAMLPANIGGLLKRAAQLRPLVAKRLAPGNGRRDFWQQFFFGRPRDAFLAGHFESFEAAVTRGLNGATGKRGCISLIEVTDDPEDLTLRAHRLLQDADVIVHGTAVPPAVLDYARRDAERRPVSDNPWSAPSPDHARTTRSLLKLAFAGQRVVRLYSIGHSVLDTELTDLNSRTGAELDITSIRHTGDSSNVWAPILDGPQIDQANHWRLAA